MFEEDTVRQVPLILDGKMGAEARRMAPPRAGDPCPRCGQAHLDYDGQLNLSCPQCSYAVGGCFT